MNMRKNKQQYEQSGRLMFLAQYDRLKQSLSTSRTSDTARRFDRLSEVQKKAIILLANEAAQRFKNLPPLTHSHLTMPFEQFSTQDKVSLMLGIKRLAELAAAMPWEFSDHAASRLEMQALRESPPPAPDGAVD
ncbi:hypothetical protein [Edwardsiella piscicida]|uniref:hypothetical protein n=1 Tax=Edwardsiella piscicida TaxID=1263550 RepID=UPI000A7E882C|nr:hypothetical protein [Edwardsiella piscicida]